MKKLATALACTLILAMAASVFGAAISGTGSGKVNTKPGEISDEELRTFFNENRELLQNVATQLIQLREELELKASIRISSNISAIDGTTKPVALSAPLMLLLEQYYNAIGAANEATIEVYEGNIVSFTFSLAVDHYKGVEYSTDPEWQKNWEESERLDTDWAIFENYMTPPIKNCWHTRLPAWLHWILRYILFGWAWM